MANFLLAAAGFVLAMVALGLVRILLGPGTADRVMSAQLLGTGGIAAVLLMSEAISLPTAVDIALILALLAAFVSVAFRGGSLDPLPDGRQRKLALGGRTSDALGSVVAGSHRRGDRRHAVALGEPSAGGRYRGGRRNGSARCHQLGRPLSPAMADGEPRAADAGDHSGGDACLGLSPERRLRAPARTARAGCLWRIARRVRKYRRIAKHAAAAARCLRVCPLNKFPAE